MSKDKGIYPNVVRGLLEEVLIQKRRDLVEDTIKLIEQFYNEYKKILKLAPVEEIVRCALPIKKLYDKLNIIALVAIASEERGVSKMIETLRNSKLVITGNETTGELDLSKLFYKLLAVWRLISSFERQEVFELLKDFGGVFLSICLDFPEILSDKRVKMVTQSQLSEVQFLSLVCLFCFSVGLWPYLAKFSSTQMCLKAIKLNCEISQKNIRPALFVLRIIDPNIKDDQEGYIAYILKCRVFSPFKMTSGGNVCFGEKIKGEKFLKSARKKGYKVKKRVGFGTYGSVFSAEKDGKKVAIKIQPANSDFIREVMILKKLKDFKHSPNIYDVWTNHSMGYIVTDFLRKCSNFLRVPKVLENLEKKFGVLHVDVHCENIMEDKCGNIVLIDFAWAVSKDDSDFSNHPLVKKGFFNKGLVTFKDLRRVQKQNINSLLRDK